jgi:hypothetical protein
MLVPIFYWYLKLKYLGVFFLRENWGLEKG